jgi:hypothetical protein
MKAGMMNNKKFAGTMATTWEVYTYDVWGNAEEGYEVNDTYNLGTSLLRIPRYINNEGSNNEFINAFPTISQIKKALGVKNYVQLCVDGDDTTIYVSDAKYYIPLGELRCISHKSLSPVESEQ